MSKYRVEFRPSRLLLIFQLLTYVVLVLSVLNWQSEIIKYQIFLQILVVFTVTVLVFRSILNSRHHAQLSVILSLRGEWLETNKDKQTSWIITDKSRTSSILLFIHLISPINTLNSKWCLIYKDQVSEQDFRRLCRAVIYQQQTSGKD